MSADERMSAVGGDGGIFANRILEEPETGRRVAAVVEAIQAGIENDIAGGRIGVHRGEGMADVILGLRLGVGKEPLALLDSQRVLGAAALENVVGSGVDRV